MRPVLTVLIVLALLTARTAHAAPAAALQLCYEDIPQAPWTMPDGSGLDLYLLKQVEAVTGERLKLVPRPWSRCIEETRVGLMDGMIGAADSPKRRLFAQPPLLADGSADPARAMHLTRVHILLRAGSQASWDGKTLVNPRGGIITQRNYFISDLMRERGERVIDSAKSSDEALRLLVGGVADVAAMMEYSGQDLLRDDARFRNQVVVAPQPLTAFPLHLLINRKRYAEDPARIEAIWNAIASVRSSASFRKHEAAELRRIGQ
ncbi:MAG: substrate-binding periplasmic protein [Massilia sp.]